MAAVVGYLLIRLQNVIFIQKCRLDHVLILHIDICGSYKISATSSRNFVLHLLICLHQNQCAGRYQCSACSGNKDFLFDIIFET